MRPGRLAQGGHVGVLAPKDVAEMDASHQPDTDESDPNPCGCRFGHPPLPSLVVSDGRPASESAEETLPH